MTTSFRETLPLPEKKDPPYLLIFLLLSVLLHLLFLWHYRYWQPAAKALEELRKKQARQIPVQIIDLPPKPKKKLTPKPPPKKPHFLADRNQVTKKETRTKESAPPPVKVKPKPPTPKPQPQVKPKPRPKPQPKPQPKAQPKPPKATAKAKPYKSPSGIPVAGKKVEKKKPAPKPQKKAPEKQTKPVEKAKPDIKKLFPTFNQLTKYDQERRRRPAPPGPNRPHLPNKLKRSTEISLNTLDYKFHSYYLALKRKIELVWEYPYAARRAGIQGRLLIRFVINQNGSLASVNILRTSGSPLLDQEAVRAIRNASPFPPLPARMNTKTLTVTATFEYLLSYRSVH